MANEFIPATNEEMLTFFPDKVSLLRLTKEQADHLERSEVWEQFCNTQGVTGQEVDFELDGESRFYKIIFFPIAAV